MRYDVNFLAVALRTALSIAAVIFFWQYVYLPSRVDVFRQRIFALRRDLFLMVAGGLISPSDPAYTHLRTRMNGLLRYADRLMLSRMILARLIYPSRAEQYLMEATEKLNQVDDLSVRNKLIRVSDQVGEEIISHVISTSPPLFLAFAPVALFVLIRARVANTLRILQIVTAPRTQPTCGFHGRWHESAMERRLVSSVEAEASTI